jgi:predicted ArsR family transcriptional regulator
LHPTRARIVALVKTTPGVTSSAMQLALHADTEALAQHVRKLEERGRLVSRPAGQERRFYLAGDPRPGGKASLEDRALGALRSKGALTASELARELGVARPALQTSLNQLSTEGAIVAEPRGFETVVRVA